MNEFRVFIIDLSSWVDLDFVEERRGVRWISIPFAPKDAKQHKRHAHVIYEVYLQHSNRYSIRE